MSTAAKRRQTKLRPKHKQTKEYLKHYYPYLPMLISIGFLLVVLFTPGSKPNNKVLSYATNISQAGLLEATNRQRSQNNVSDLESNGQLAQAAQAKAQDMITRDYWSHKTPEGSDPWTFIVASKYDYQKAGENLAHGFDTSSDVINGWMNSSTHKLNMLDKEFTQTGFGIASNDNYNGSGPATVVVAMYARPLAVATSTSKSVGQVLGEDKNISNIQLLTKQTWSVYAVGILVGAAVTYLALSHSLALRRAFARGEKFIFRHPIVDSVMIASLAVGLLLLKTAGSIL